MADIEEDVPPLEDMSPLLKQLEGLKEIKSHDLPEKIKTETNSNVINSKAEDHNKSQKSTSFGGMKKGFLFSSNNKSRTNSSNKQKSPLTDDIPYIKQRETDTSNLKISEVQNSMAAGESFLQNKDWMTEDLLEKIEGNDVLLRKLSNPEFSKAISEFQTNPQAAMMKYADNNEMQKFLKEFCGVMGDHFSRLGQKQGNNCEIPNIRTKPLISDNEIKEENATPQINREDEKQLENIMSSPEIKQVLMDEQIQKLFQILKTNPPAGERILRESDTELKRKIKVLIDAGLLQVQQR